MASPSDSQFRGKGQPSPETLTATDCEAEALEVVIAVLRDAGNGRSAGSTRLRAAEIIFERAKAEREAGKASSVPQSAIDKARTMVLVDPATGQPTTAAAELQRRLAKSAAK